MRVADKLLKIEEAQFPARISSLVHVLTLIDDLLLSPEEALIKAAATNQLAWLDNLVESYNPDLTDAIENASAHGWVDMVVRLIHHSNDRKLRTHSAGQDDERNEEFVATSTRKVLRNVVRTAALFGKLDLVSTFLPQIANAGADANALEEMYMTTWQALEAAAGAGWVNVVVFLVDYATTWGYIESYEVAANDDALVCAISGNSHTVATYLLGVCEIQWDLKRAYEIAVERQQLDLVEWIGALSTQYPDVVME